jgi:triphosphoribosyl-dephospho-CoA synthetase
MRLPWLVDTVSSAAVTPKPGMVDRANNGAHADMDFFTFIDSVVALLPWFSNCALAGFDSGCGPNALFESLKPPGQGGRSSDEKSHRRC